MGYSYSTGSPTLCVLTGIGFAIAKKLARAPGHVCILTSRDRARGEQAVEDLSQEGLKAIFKQLDIGDPSSVEVNVVSAPLCSLISIILMLMTVLPLLF